MLRWMVPIALMAGLVGGCEREPAPAAETPAPPNPALQRLDRDLTVESKANRVTVMNLDSYRRADQRFARQEDELVMFDRIPYADTHSDEALAAQLAKSGEPAAVTIGELKTTRRPGTPRPLPETTTEAFDWQPSDLLVTWDVSFRVDALTRTRVLQWWRGLPEHLPRLLMVRSMTEVPGGWEVTGEVYGFRRVEVPRHVATVPSFAERLEKRGLSRAALSSPADAALLAEVETLAREIEGDLPKVERSLQVLAHTHMRDARWRIFTNKVTEVEALNLPKLLR